MNSQEFEEFKPISVRRGERALADIGYAARQCIGLKLLTCLRFLKARLSSFDGNLLDVGYGEMPFLGLAPQVKRYVRIDVKETVSFGMAHHPDIVLFDGVNIPFPDHSFDCLLCTEVLKHTVEPDALIAEILRVLRGNGTLLITVPFTARVHYASHDFRRLTRYQLARMLSQFGTVSIQARENYFAILENKMIVLTARLLMSPHRFSLIWTLPMIVLCFSPLSILFLTFAHVSMAFGLGLADEPLSYGCVEVKKG